MKCKMEIECRESVVGDNSGAISLSADVPQHLLFTLYLLERPSLLPYLCCRYLPYVCPQRAFPISNGPLIFAVAFGSHDGLFRACCLL